MMNDNKPTMSVTIQVQGNELAPTLSEIVDGMTDEAKSSLAAQLAKEYFVRQMSRETRGHRWGNNDGSRYLESLCHKVEGSIQQTIREDPELIQMVTDTVEAMRPQFPDFVKSAVVHVLGQLVTQGFSECFDTKIQIADLRKRLESQVISSGD